MLRYSYLPSDFHPMVLMLGAPADLAGLSALLRRYALAPAPTPLAASGLAAPSDTSIVLTEAGEQPGLWPMPGTAKTFRWTLDAEWARQFAGVVDALIGDGRKAGSELLVCEVAGETPLKVSFGEFTDDFLVNQLHANG